MKNIKSMITSFSDLDIVFCQVRFNGLKEFNILKKTDKNTNYWQSLKC